MRSDSENEDCLCIVRLKPYSESKSGQDWIQCTACKKWAHYHCGGEDPFYVCLHCSSDLSFSAYEDDQYLIYWLFSLHCKNFL